MGYNGVISGALCGCAQAGKSDRCTIPCECVAALANTITALHEERRHTHVGTVSFCCDHQHPCRACIFLSADAWIEIHPGSATLEFHLCNESEVLLLLQTDDQQLMLDFIRCYLTLVAASPNTVAGRTASLPRDAEQEWGTTKSNVGR